MTPFSFATATEIHFGRGQATGALSRLAALGRRVLVVHGGSPERSGWLVEGLSAAGAEVARLSVPREPDVAMIEEGVALARSFGARAVVALGGGAVVDAGKAVAALVPATRPLLDHLEVVGRGLPLDAAPLPFAAIPTTAGTGAEVTRNAVLGVPEQRRKVSLRDPRMLPRLAVVDPALTDGCPLAVTLASGLDAVTQVIEPFLSSRANALTDAICRDAIPTGLSALRRLMDGEDAEARDAMAWTSLCGGLALANAGLGAVHGLAGPLGGLTGAAHGAICGTLLPHVLIANRRAATDPALVARFEAVAGWIGAAMGVVPGASLETAAGTLAEWSRAQGLPGLTALGLGPDARGEVADAAVAASSMKANPVPLSREDLFGIMAAAA